MGPKLALATLMLVLSGSVCVAAGADEVAPLLETAAKHRREGNLRLAIESLEPVCTRPDAPCDPRLLGELGVAYYQAHRFAQAAGALNEAYARAGSATERALFANDLGNLSASRGHRDEAVRYYEEARAKAGSNAAIAVSAGLNLARLAPQDGRLAQLQALSGEIAGIADPRERARYYLNLGAQARALGPPALKLSYEHLDRARTLARQLGDRWLLAETLDALSQLYEDRGRTADALKLTDEGIASLQAEHAPDFLINMQWRRARLLRQQGHDDLALQAYQAAVEHIETVRQDIPVEYFDGRSSFRETLEPIYLGLAELLLRQADAAGMADQAQLFRRARDTVELIKQTELQDYLGDRCTVESARPLRSSALLPGTAVLYPVILEKRLELLLETRDGIESRHVDIDARSVRDLALAFAASIRDEKPDYLARARELYDLILRPLEQTLSRQKVDTIVVVPDGALRLIPLGALHDGERFAIAKFAIAIAPGLTMTSAARSEKGPGRVLLAGLSEPGPVLDKLPKMTLERLGRSETTRGGTRSVDLKEGLTLPGVTEEIAELKRATRSDRLLNEEFTVDRFRTQVSSGDYRIVHIASHAMFSQSAETSFILAYDDLLTIDELQSLLRGEQVQKNPIELLSLSACQTAEGDDRAPLGIAGAALRARAQTALGSLWPVDDQATKTLMVRFYELLTTGEMTKAQALQRAQLELIRNPSFDHPFFWAPFILVGSWL